MCVVSPSECRSMAQADAHAKPLCSSQPVGLLAILVDSSSVPLSIFGQQKLVRHVSYPNNYQTKSSASPRTPYPEQNVQQKMIKKVRFAPDVVEPTGDSRAYRCGRDVNKVTHKKDYKERQEHNEMEKNAKRHDTSSPSTVVSSCHHRDCEKLVKPTLPVNRMLLYKGMQCYKSKMMPCL